MSSASDSPIKYEPSLVQSLFLHVLETGLQDEAVRAKLRPFLEKTTVNDEQLLEKVNQIMPAEMEPCNKMSSGSKKGLRVNQVGTSSVSSNPAPGQPGQTPGQRHFVKLYQLWQTKIIEKTGNDRRHLSVIYRRRNMHK